jgi:hypothetical protein
MAVHYLGDPNRNLCLVLPRQCGVRTVIVVPSFHPSSSSMALVQPCQAKLHLSTWLQC